MAISGLLYEHMELKYAIVYDWKVRHENRMAKSLMAMLKSHSHHVQLLQIGATLSVESYDYIILGTTMLHGKVSPIMEEFISRNEEILAEKRVSLFLCIDSNEGDVHAQFQSAFPQWLRRHALAKAICCKTKISEDWGIADRLIVGSETIDASRADAEDTFIGEFYESIVT